MTKAQIELLMTRDVDQVSEAAVRHPPKQLGVTLKNAAVLLAREERKNGVEERLFVFKLLRFVQAALAGSRAQVTAEVAREIFVAVRLLLKRNIAPDVNRAARDMLSVLLTERTAKALIENRFVPIEDILAVYQHPSDEPRSYLSDVRALAALRAKLAAKHTPTSKVQSVKAEVASKPKGLAH